jgi:MYXO-CTERM domain-containing protein
MGRISAALVFLMIGCQGVAPESSQAGLNYEPGQPYATSCPPCTATHGTCDPTTCDIKCDDGFSNCDGDLTNGCEAPLSDVNSCGACGHNCNACWESATCSGGACGGRARPNGAACTATSACSRSGMCFNGECVCPDDTDMAESSPVGVFPDLSVVAPKGLDIPGDCSFTGGGTATASVLLLLSAVVLLWRRRRRT